MEGKISNPIEKISILIVDDDVGIIDLLSNILSVFGFKDVVSANDGRSAIKKMKNKRFDIIISDWQMEPMDGISFVKYVRKGDDSPDCLVPIIMLTGRAEVENVKKARDAGVTEFLAKPFTAEDLRKRILSVIDNPREFVFADAYTGPSRRRKEGAPPEGQERRKGTKKK